MRPLVLLVLSAVLLSACGSGGSAGTAPEKATPSPQAHSLADLEAALPAKGQVPSAARKKSTCPGETWCRKGEVSVEYELRPAGKPEEAERRAKVAFLVDQSSVTAKLVKDDAAAKAFVANARRSTEKYDGAFDIKLKPIGASSYQPGEKGTGNVAEVAMSRWHGFVASRTQKFSGWRDNRSKAVEVNDTTYDVSFLMVADHRVVITAYAAVDAEARGPGAAERLARRLATDYIERLG